MAVVAAGGGWVGTAPSCRALCRQLRTRPGPDDDAKKSTATKVKEVVAVIAPFVFIAGLLIGVAYALDAVIVINAGRELARRRREGCRCALPSAHGAR